MERYTKPTLIEIEMLERAVFCDDSESQTTDPLKNVTTAIKGFFKINKEEAGDGFTDAENTTNTDESGFNTEQEIIDEAKELNEEPNKGILEELFSGNDNDESSGGNELIIEDEQVNTPIDETNTDGGF